MLVAGISINFTYFRKLEYIYRITLRKKKNKAKKLNAVIPDRR